MDLPARVVSRTNKGPRRTHQEEADQKADIVLPGERLLAVRPDVARSRDEELIAHVAPVASLVIGLGTQSVPALHTWLTFWSRTTVKTNTMSLSSLLLPILFCLEIA